VQDRRTYGGHIPILTDEQTAIVGTGEPIFLYYFQLLIVAGATGQGLFFFHRRDKLRRLILWLSYLLNRQIYQEKFKPLERLIVKISLVD